MQDESKIKMSSNKNFGLIFFIVFIILGLWPLWSEGQINIWLIIISFVFLLLAITKSKLLTPLNLLWFKFGIILGSIFAPIIMALVFFLVITPIGIFMKVIGKDLLDLKNSKKKETYWKKRDLAPGSMKRQF